MKNSIKTTIQKGSIILIILVLTYSYSAKAQDSTLNTFKRKKIISLGIGENGYSISYTSFCKKERAYEVLFGYRKGKDLTSIIFFSFNDPFWCYNQFVFSAGLKFYNSRSFYLEPMIVSNYGSYDNILFSEYKGIKNYYPLISREKMGIGAITKFGFTPPIKRRFVVDIYLGLGFRISHINEKIVDPDELPVNVNRAAYWKQEPTVHIGFQIGIILNKI